MENRKLTRSNHRMIAGVCAGLAEYFGWDVTVVRVVYTLLTFFTVFSGVIVYVVLWIVMPEQSNKDNYRDRMNDRLNNR
ncbi:PspC domain-containing protein [Phocaeicola sp.]